MGNARSGRSEEAVQRLITLLDVNAQAPLETLAYRFDIVLRGRRQTVVESKLQGS